jgi:hypothetical protein
VAFLFLETENGGANDFGSESCRHVSSFQLSTISTIPLLTCRYASLLIIIGAWGNADCS